MNKEQEDALLDDSKPALGYAKLTIRDCIMRRFAKVATPTWEALCQLEAGEISKGKALQIIREEAERMERENFPEMETELQQLRLAADGMRDALDCIANQPDKTATGMRACAKAALATYRAAGEGSPKDTGTSRE